MSSENKYLRQFEEWLRKGDPNRPPKSKATANAYVYTVEHFRSFLNGRPLSEELAKAFVSNLESKGNSPRSISRHIYALRSYFRFRGLELNLESSSVHRAAPRWLTDEELRSLISVVNRPLEDKGSSRWQFNRALLKRALLLVYVGAGLRLSEGCSLKRQDVDSRGYIWVLGKDGKDAVVCVTPEVIRAIKEWLNTHTSDWMFPGKNGNHIHPRTAQGIIRELMEEAGIKDLRQVVTTLRHTMGVNLVKRGADIWDIQKSMRFMDTAPGQRYLDMVSSELIKELGGRPDIPKSTPEQPQDQKSLNPQPVFKKDNISEPRQAFEKHQESLEVKFMRNRRNIVSLSHVPIELEDWAREEAERRKMLGLPEKYIYLLYTIPMEEFKEKLQNREYNYYLKDDQGPYYSLKECLDGLDVPLESRNED